MSQIQPPPAAYFSPTHSQAVADFFGAPPPPYSEPLPEYKQHDTSLARYMFKYGFLFPPFWLMGIAILMSPLQIPDDWETGKTEDERAAVLARLRADEVKWGWRCLWATVVLVCVLGIVGAVIYLCKVF